MEKNIMKKSEIIEILKKYNCDCEELKGQSKEDLEELLQEYRDDSDMYPNGRDFEAEDED